MTNEELKNIISKWYSTLEFVETGTPYLKILVPSDYLRELAVKLKEDVNLAFDYLFSLTGVDFGDSLGVVYYLESTEQRHFIALEVKTDNRKNPQIDTVSDIWPAAYLNELEVYDFFGIFFKGNHELYRIFMGEEWEGFPLRKDYVDNVNMIIRE